MAGSGPHIVMQEFDSAWPACQWRDSHVLLGVSGGADSVALLRAAVELKESNGGTGTIYVGHFNHALRGNESEDDQRWVEVLCHNYGLDCKVGSAAESTDAVLRSEASESTARTLRYEFLTQTAELLGARYVAVAHTADDQAETVLHRIIRGTGLRGLTGMSIARPLSSSVSLVRPLLKVRRSEVINYLESIRQEYRSDSTNQDVAWTRNRIRSKLLPMLTEDFNPDVVDALLRLGSQAAEVQQLMQQQADELGARSVKLHYNVESTDAIRKPAKRLDIDCAVLTGRPAALVREVCRSAWLEAEWPQQAMSFDDWQQLALLIAGSSGLSSMHLPSGVFAYRRGSHLVLEHPGLA